MTDARPPVPKLAIAAILAAAFRSLHDHRAALARLFWFPLAAISAAETLSRAVSGRQLDPLEVAGDATVLGGVALALTLATIAVVPAATAWHRLILEGPEAAPARYRLGVRELRYAAYLLLYSAIVITTAVPIGYAVFWGAIALVEMGMPLGFEDVWSVGLWASTAGMLLALFATVRLFLLFPDAAIGHHMGLRQAGRASSGNQVRLFVASVVPMLPIVLVRSATETAPDASLALKAAAAVTATALLIPFFAVSVSVLSLSYRQLCPPQPVRRDPVSV